MTLLDVVVRLGLGAVGVAVLVFLYIAVLVPAVSRIGRFMCPDESETLQLALGFLILWALVVLIVAIWFLGDWIVGYLFVKSL